MCICVANNAIEEVLVERNCGKSSRCLLHFMPVVCYAVSILLSPVCLFAQAAVFLCFSGVWLIALKFV